MEKLDNGSLKPYKAYEIEPIKKFSDKVRKKAKLVKKEFYKCPKYFGNKYFKMVAR